VRGMREIDRGEQVEPGRVRRSGGGRKLATSTDPELEVALEQLVEPVSRSDPESPLRWTCKSTRVLAKELAVGGYPASDWLVRQIL